MTEAQLQDAVRLWASRRGWYLWRNNVGVLRDMRGRPVRYGLANDSAHINAAIKSADLIGWDSEGRFVSVEIKGPRGRVHPAQEAWAQLVNAAGGRAYIIRNLEDLPR